MGLPYHTPSTMDETPFSVEYGFEAVVQNEFGILTYRVANYNDRGNEVALRGELNLVEEKGIGRTSRWRPISRESLSTIIKG